MTRFSLENQSSAHSVRRKTVSGESRLTRSGRLDGCDAEPGPQLAGGQEPADPLRVLLRLPARRLPAVPALDLGVDLVGPFGPLLRAVAQVGVRRVREREP